MNVGSHRKRAANEPVEVLLGRDEQAPAAGSVRPLSITLGALFVLGRGVAGLVWPQFVALGAIGAALFGYALTRFRKTIRLMA